MDLPTIAITEEMLEPLVQGVVANISVLLPIGLSLMTLFLGIRIIPGLLCGGGGLSGHRQFFRRCFPDVWLSYCITSGLGAYRRPVWDACSFVFPAWPDLRLWLQVWCGLVRDRLYSFPIKIR